MATATKASTGSTASRPTATRKGTSSGSVSSHRSFQSVLPCGNKLLQKKWDKTYYDEHRRLVKTAKPMVDTKAPQVRPHVTSKWKKQQLAKERAEEIDRDNLTLLKKMQQIMKTEGAGVDHKNTYRHHSLNQSQRQREMERVAKENREMLKRLEKVEPMYKVSDWIEDWRRKEDITGMITAYPDDFQAISSSKPKKSSSTTNPEASDKKKAPTEAEKTAGGVQVDDENSQNETATEQSTKDSEEHKTEE